MKYIECMSVICYQHIYSTSKVPSVLEEELFLLHLHPVRVCIQMILSPFNRINASLIPGVLVLFNRLHRNSPEIITYEALSSIMVVLFLLASKFCDDYHIFNIDISESFNISINVFNSMERYIFSLLDFDCSITSSEFTKASDYLEQVTALVEKHILEMLK
jgi:hypothetical protein